MTRKPLTVVDVTKLTDRELMGLYRAGFDVPYPDPFIVPILPPGYADSRHLAKTAEWMR